MPIEQQRSALVLGATGGIGGETAHALARYGWRIRALAREPSASLGRSGPLASGWEWVAGDAMDGSSVLRAAQGASVIVHAVNPPGYRDWGRLVLPMIDNTIAAARAVGARIVMPGTIYNYEPDAVPVVTEDTPQHSDTRKGKIRIQLEDRLRVAARDDAPGGSVRTLIVRAGDYFGPRPGNGWFSQSLVKPGRLIQSVTNPGRRGIGHAWAYLPDVAETFARLLAREHDLPRFAVFNHAGHWDASGYDMVEAIIAAAADPTVRVKAMPWTLLVAASPFSPALRELIEVQRYWRAPMRLDNTRLLGLIGSEPHTCLADAVRATLAGLGCVSSQGQASEPYSAKTGLPRRR